MTQGWSTDYLDTRYLTFGEIARITRVSKMTMYRELHVGRLDCIRIGRSFRVPEESARRWMSAAGSAS